MEDAGVKRDDLEMGAKSELGFDDRTIRRGFIRKVFAILSVQLSFVTGLIALFVFNDRAILFVQRHPHLYFASYGVFLVTYLALACCPSVRRSFPGNVICLALLTGAMGYMAAMISCMYRTEIVFMSMGICAGCCFFVILFASQTAIDFTKLTGVLFVVFMVVFLFGFVSLILVSTGNGSRILLAVYSGLMALVFMVYLAVDVQMLIGGKQYELSPEDYVFAAAQIFVDIVNIFLLLLQLFGDWF